MSDVLYKAVVKEPNCVNKTYICNTTEFKPRYWAHIAIFSNEKYSNSTTLAAYTDTLKKNNRKYTIEWSILATIPNINVDIRKCNLCTKESLLTLYNYRENLLNKIADILPRCNHKYIS